MALQSNFFGKREAETLNPRTNPALGSHASVLQGGSGSSGSSTTGYGTAVQPSSTNTSAASQPAAPAAAETAPASESPSKLTVGPNIKLKGVEITDCDTLVVEGLVEATMNSRVIQIASQGAFKGSAEIDIAEIHGSFEGNLTAKQKLVIYATGKVTGKIRYGKVVIEEGGQISGEIQVAGSGTSSNSGGSGSSYSSSNALRDDPVTV